MSTTTIDVGAASMPQSAGSLAAPLLAGVKQRSYELMRIQPGQSVLDVGCGAGYDTLALAALVGEDGFVMGVDSSKVFIETAERRALAAGLGARVRHRIVNALSLPLRDAGYDACRSERTFQLVAEPERALAEMVRVTRPGGRVVVVDTDWATASIDTPMPDVERVFRRLLLDHLLPNPYSGRSLYRLMRAQGLEEVELEAVAITTTSLGALRHLAHLDRLESMALERALLSEARVAAWRASLEAAHEANTLFGQITLNLGSSTVPLGASA